MEKRIKTLKGVCFVSVFLVLFGICQQLFQPKWVAGGKDDTITTSNWEEYNRLEKNTLDVIFIGTSHAMYAMDPMYMYSRSGLAGYVFSGPGMRMDLTYFTLEEALKTQNPKIVFLDVSAFHFKNQQKEAKVHMAADVLPLSRGKWEFAFHTGSEDLDPLGILFPFFRYHARWTDLKKNDFKGVTGDLDKTSLRGHYISYRQIPAELDFNKDTDFSLIEDHLKYLDRMVELCRERGIELILYKVPSPPWRRAHSEAAAQAAKDRGLVYLELYYEMERMGIDTELDFSDNYDHVNQYGAEKISDYILQYMEEHGGINDHRGSYADWDRDYSEYLQYKALVKEKAEEELIEKIEG